MWTIMRGGTPEYESPFGEWPDEGPGEDPFEEARVPLGPPRKPLQSGAVALPLPEPEEWDVEAYGRAADGG
jgi:hypothetical protein